jgi:PEP-CTERM motif
MRKIAAIGAVLVAAGLASLPAHASNTVENISFSMGGFTDINGSPALPSPVSTITGSFSATFDPTLDYDDDTTDLIINSFNSGSLTLDSPLGFTYFATGTYAGDIFFGGTENDSSFAEVGTNDFVLALNLSNPGVPTYVSCAATGIQCGANTGNTAYDASAYTTQGTNSIWAISAADSTAGVPEPATWAMFLVGFGAVGFAMRRPLRKLIVPFA